MTAGLIVCDNCFVCIAVCMQDMLDQAFGLTATSRLGCQVILTEAHDNLQLTVPSATRNFYVDGHVPKPH